MTPQLEVGRVVKPHGIRGEVVVDLVSNRPERRLAEGSVLGSDRGPLEVVASRPHQGRWIVAFTGVTDRNEAEALRGTVLSAEALAEEGALWVHELVGAEVVDASGRRFGAVEAVEANPASDLLVLPGGHLVPLVFVVQRLANGTVVIDPPPGLFDL
ncbi:MAG TPA: ribosome maturation factor RimM [Acidimicrobiales bacterium]|nr:ribosome maturation factor RimM [Acidimicrobiales bacterium]